MSIKHLKELLLEIKQIHSIEALVQWDQETQMPEGSAKIRAEHLAYLGTKAHTLLTGRKFKNTLAKNVDLETGEPLDPSLEKNTKRLLYLVWRDYHQAIALPVHFVKEITYLASVAQHEWIKCRANNDFLGFAPYLEKLVKLKQKAADYYGYTTTRYDSLLDKFEPGMTSSKLTALFDPMRQRLVQLVQRIRNSTNQVDNSPLKQFFPAEKQWEFGKSVLSAMGFDWNYGRQDKSAHPFTTSFHPTDVRITTRIDEHFFNTAFFGTIHEGGHALYEMGLPVQDYGTPLGEAISYGFHESQSRLWENLIARSHSFWNHFYPLVQGYFPEALAQVEQSEFYRMINRVEPSLIRVEADEVTYTLHIMLRFEIEKMLINEDLPVKELPLIWNDKMEEYFGLRPDSDKDGVLQDVHWSMGAFGYFPSYALGNVYAVPILEQAHLAIPELPAQIQNGQLLPLRHWLLENIHQLGSQKDPEELITAITGKPLTAEPFMRYLETKYQEIY